MGRLIKFGCILHSVHHKEWSTQNTFARLDALKSISQLTMSINQRTALELVFVTIFFVGNSWQMLFLVCSFKSTNPLLKSHHPIIQESTPPNAKCCCQQDGNMSSQHEVSHSSICCTPRSLTARPWKMVVGRQAFPIQKMTFTWDMFNLGRVGWKGITKQRHWKTLESSDFQISLRTYPPYWKNVNLTVTMAGWGFDPSYWGCIKSL